MAGVRQRGPTVNRLTSELRQHRILVARLTASLKLQDDDGDPLSTPRGAARGVYKPGAVK